MSETTALVKALLDIIPESDAQTWKIIGSSLYAMRGFDNVYRDIWIERTSKSLHAYWEGLRCNMYMVGFSTLRQIAKLANPNRYRTIMDAYIKTIVQQATILALQHELCLVYAQEGLEKGEWYIFSQHRWKKIKQDILFNNLNLPKSQSIVKDMQELFREPSIQFDADSTLIGFNNGIFDLSNKLFREGYPIDFVSMSTKTDYSNTQFQTILLPYQLSYTLDLIASSLIGNRRHAIRKQSRNIKFNNAIQDTLGDYHTRCFSKQGIQLCLDEIPINISELLHRGMFLLENCYIMTPIERWFNMHYEITNIDSHIYSLSDMMSKASGFSRNKICAHLRKLNISKIKKGKLVYFTNIISV